LQAPLASLKLLF